MKMGFGWFGGATFSKAHVCIDEDVNDRLKLIRTIYSEQRITCSPRGRYTFKLPQQINQRTVWLIHIHAHKQKQNTQNNLCALF